MKYSESYRWFYGVIWLERNTTVDCLVDVSELEISAGYWVVEEHGQLKIVSTTSLSITKPNDLKIIGHAIKWNIQIP